MNPETVTFFQILSLPLGITGLAILIWAAINAKLDAKKFNIENPRIWK